MKGSFVYNLSKGEVNRYKNYSIDQYVADIQEKGLEKTWNDLCCFVLQFEKGNTIVNINNFAELYEYGLAIKDKNQKKKRGQYYTPDDVANVMGQWLEECEGDNICDVACGTGKLILTYLEIIGREKAISLIKEGKVYLYDYDKTALKICKTSLLVTYGVEWFDDIHVIEGDFLDKKVNLPHNCKTISNPPYASIKKIGKTWNVTDVIRESHEWYAAFMEKIFEQSKSAVVISPFSFISGKNFFSLRKEMCDRGNGWIVAFDNIPGNIFYGRKQGVFNSNTSNSVRAAITTFHASKQQKGFKVSPMIRFKNEERKLLLDSNLLKNMIDDDLQIITPQNISFKKIAKPLKNIYKNWVEKSSYTIKDFITTSDNHFFIDMPNTCRYNTTASSKKLSRSGSIGLHVKNEDEFFFLYCFINSSFAYWWWRIYDGGITYPKGLLYDMPLPYNLLKKEDKESFKEIALKMIPKEKDFIATKVNAGVAQENIKFPKEYARMIDEKLLKLIGCTENEEVFEEIHANQFFYKNEKIQ